jgi:alcohol dehydrogenase YqhD (iron-dependent ADH family)
MMICGTLAHNGITNYGKGKIFIVHKAEHILSGIYPELTHGQGIALLMPKYLEINKNQYKDKILKMGRMVFQMKSTPSCNAVIAKLKEWLNSLPIAHNYDELAFQVKQEDLAKAEKVLKVK